MNLLAFAAQFWILNFEFSSCALNTLKLKSYITPSAAYIHTILLIHFFFFINSKLKLFFLSHLKFKIFFIIDLLLSNNYRLLKLIAKINDDKKFISLKKIYLFIIEDIFLQIRIFYKYK